MALVPEAYKLTRKPLTTFTRTVPTIPEVLDLRRIQQNVQTYNVAKKERETMYSVLDPILNKAARNRLADNAWYGDIPVLRDVLVTIDGYVNIIGRMANLTDPLNALMTTLRFFGDSLDTVATIVKAPLTAWAKGTSVGEEYVRQFGLGDSGRYASSFSEINKYVDWIPDGWVMDLAGEILIDPMNWVSFGAAGAAKKVAGGSSKVLGELLVDTATKYGDDIAGAVSVLRKSIGSSDEVIEMVYTYMRSGGDDALKALKTKQVGSMVRRFNDFSFREEYTEFEKLAIDILKKTDKPFNITDVRKAYDTTKRMTSQFKAAKFLHTIDEYEKTMIKFMSQFTPAGAVYRGTKYIHHQSLRVPQAKLDEVLKQVDDLKDIRFDKYKNLTFDQMRANVKTLQDSLKEKIELLGKTTGADADALVKDINEQTELMKKAMDQVKYKHYFDTVYKPTQDLIEGNNNLITQLKKERLTATFARQTEIDIEIDELMENNKLQESLRPDTTSVANDIKMLEEAAASPDSLEDFTKLEEYDKALKRIREIKNAYTKDTDLDDFVKQIEVALPKEIKSALDSKAALHEIENAVNALMKEMEARMLRVNAVKRILSHFSTSKQTADYVLAMLRQNTKAINFIRTSTKAVFEGYKKEVADLEAQLVKFSKQLQEAWKMKIAADASDTDIINKMFEEIVNNKRDIESLTDEAITRTFRQYEDALRTIQEYKQVIAYKANDRHMMDLGAKRLAILTNNYKISEHDPESLRGLLKDAIQILENQTSYKNRQEVFDIRMKILNKEREVLTATGEAKANLTVELEQARKELNEAIKDRTDIRAAKVANEILEMLQTADTKFAQDEFVLTAQMYTTVKRLVGEKDVHGVLEVPFQGELTAYHKAQDDVLALQNKLRVRYDDDNAGYEKIARKALAQERSKYLSANPDSTLGKITKEDVLRRMLQYKNEDDVIRAQIKKVREDNPMLRAKHFIDRNLKEANLNLDDLEEQYKAYQAELLTYKTKKGIKMSVAQKEEMRAKYALVFAFMEGGKPIPGFENMAAIGDFVHKNLNIAGDNLFVSAAQTEFYLYYLRQLARNDGGELFARESAIVNYLYMFFKRNGFEQYTHLKNPGQKAKMIGDLYNDLVSLQTALQAPIVDREHLLGMQKAYSSRLAKVINNTLDNDAIQLKIALEELNQYGYMKSIMNKPAEQARSQIVNKVRAILDAQNFKEVKTEDMILKYVNSLIVASHNSIFKMYTDFEKNIRTLYRKMAKDATTIKFLEGISRDTNAPYLIGAMKNTVSQYFRQIVLDQTKLDPKLIKEILDLCDNQTMPMDDLLRQMKVLVDRVDLAELGEANASSLRSIKNIVNDPFAANKMYHEIWARGEKIAEADDITHHMVMGAVYGSFLDPWYKIMEDIHTINMLHLGRDVDKVTGRFTKINALTAMEDILNTVLSFKRNYNGDIPGAIKLSQKELSKMQSYLLSTYTEGVPPALLKAEIVKNVADLKDGDAEELVSKYIEARMREALTDLSAHMLTTETALDDLAMAGLRTEMDPMYQPSVFNELLGNDQIFNKGFFAQLKSTDGVKIGRRLHGPTAEVQRLQKEYDDLKIKHKYGFTTTAEDVAKAKAALDKEIQADLGRINLKNSTYVYVDFETQEAVLGDKSTNRAFQLNVRMVDASGKETTKTYFLSMDNQQKLQSYTSKLTNITDETYQNAPKYGLADRTLLKQMTADGINIDDNMILVAHNATFDMDMFRGIGIEANPVVLDTLPFFRALYTRHFRGHAEKELLLEIRGMINQELVNIDNISKQLLAGTKKESQRAWRAKMDDAQKALFAAYERYKNIANGGEGASVAQKEIYRKDLIRIYEGVQRNRFKQDYLAEQILGPEKIAELQKETGLTFHNAEYDTLITKELLNGVNPRTNRKFLDELMEDAGVETIQDLNNYANDSFRYSFRKGTDGVFLDLDIAILNIKERPVWHILESNHQEIVKEVTAIEKSAKDITIALKTHDGQNLDAIARGIADLQERVEELGFLAKYESSQDMMATNSASRFLQFGTKPIVEGDIQDVWHFYQDLKANVEALNDEFTLAVAQQNAMLSAIYGNATGYLRTSPTVNTLTLLQAYGGNHSLNMMRHIFNGKMINFENVDNITFGWQQAIRNLIHKNFPDFPMSSDFQKYLKFFREKYPRDPTVKLMGLLDGLQENFEMMNEIMSILKAGFKADDPNTALVFSKFHDFMSFVDRDFHKYIERFGKDLQGAQGDPALYEKLSKQIEEDLFLKFMEAATESKLNPILKPREFLQTIKGTSNGDAFNVFYKHYMKVLTRATENYKNGVPVITHVLFNPSTDATNEIYHTFKTYINDVLAQVENGPQSTIVGMTTNETLNYGFVLGESPLFKDFNELLRSAIGEMRDPLRAIRMERKIGEMNPIHIGRASEHLLKLKESFKTFDPVTGKGGPFAYDPTTNFKAISNQTQGLLNDMTGTWQASGMGSYHTIQYTDATREAKKVYKVVNTLYEGVTDKMKDFIPYMDTDPNTKEFYKTVMELIEGNERYIPRSLAKTAYRDFSSDMLHALVSDYGDIAYFGRIRAKLDAFRERLSDPYGGFNLKLNKTKDGVDPEAVDELMKRIEYIIYENMRETLPKEYREAITELLNRGVRYDSLVTSQKETMYKMTRYLNDNYTQMRGLFSTPEEFLSWVQKGEAEGRYVVVLVKDPKSQTGMRVMRHRFKDINDVQTFDTMMNIGNTGTESYLPIGLMDAHEFQVLERTTRQRFRFEEGGIPDFIRKVILMPMKSMMLLSANFMLGNIVDINMKNLVMQEGGIFSAQTVLADVVTAAKWGNKWEHYYEIASNMLNYRNYKGKYGHVWVEELRKEFARQGKLTDALDEDLKIVQLVNDFKKTPAAASEMVDMIERMQAGVIGTGKDTKPIFNMVNKIFYGSFPFKHNLEINGQMEFIGRLALHINDIKKGLTANESLVKILKTHFNYSNKTKAELYAEFLIPFASYPIRSFGFWQDAFFKNARNTRFLTDLLTTAWGQETLSDNEYAKYQASRGNLPIKNYVMQTNLTFMDSFSVPYFDKYPVPQQLIRKLNPLLKQTLFTPELTGGEKVMRMPGLSQVKTIYNLVTTDRKSLDVVLPSVADTYFQTQKTVMRSTFAQRRADMSKPYSYNNGRLQFKGAIRPDAMKQLSYKWTEIQAGYRR